MKNKHFLAFLAAWRLGARILKIGVAFKVACGSKTKGNERGSIKAPPLGLHPKRGIKC